MQKTTRPRGSELFSCGPKNCLGGDEFPGFIRDQLVIQHDIADNTCPDGDLATDDDILFEAIQMVDATRDGSVDQDAGGILERGSTEEAIRPNEGALPSVVN